MTPSAGALAAKAAIDAAAALVRASQLLIDNAHAQMTATPPTLTLDDYRDLVNHHAAVIGNAAMIRHATVLDLGASIKHDTAALRATTETLNQQITVLALVPNVVDRASRVVVAAAVLATLTTAPSLMTVDAVVTAVFAIWS
jgi:hypothetical protein